MKKGLVIGIIGAVLVGAGIFVAIRFRKKKIEQEPINQEKENLISEIIAATAGTTMKFDTKLLNKLVITELKQLKYLVLKIKNKQPLTAADKETMTTLIEYIKSVK